MRVLCLGCAGEVLLVEGVADSVEGVIVVAEMVIVVVMVVMAVMTVMDWSLEGPADGRQHL